MSPAPFRRAKEPGPLTTKVAGCPFQSDWVFHRLLLAAIAPAPVVEDHAVGLDADVDVRDFLAID